MSVDPAAVAAIQSEAVYLVGHALAILDGSPAGSATMGAAELATAHETLQLRFDALFSGQSGRLADELANAHRPRALIDLFTVLRELAAIFTDGDFPSVPSADLAELRDRYGANPAA